MPDLHPAPRKVLESLGNHWTGLTVFVEHPEVPMDNNTAERSERGPVVGRKNYYGKYSVNPPASVQRVPCPRPRPRLAVGSVIGIPRRNLTMRRGYDVSGAGTSSSHPHARLCSGLRFHGRNRSTSSTARPPAWAHASR